MGKSGYKVLRTCFKIILAIAGLYILVGCTAEGYETGNGELSYLKTEYADVVVQRGVVTAVVTDEDVMLPIKAGQEIGNATDTIMRGMVHYSVPHDGNEAELLGMKSVSLLAPIIQGADTEPLITDPVQLISWWVSPNGRYVNISLGLRTGTAEDVKAVQKLRLIGDGNGVYTLHHDQGSIPMYYTKEVYISVPAVLLMKNDSMVTLRINTFNGMKEMTIGNL